MPAVPGRNKRLRKLWKKQEKEKRIADANRVIPSEEEGLRRAGIRSEQRRKEYDEKMRKLTNKLNAEADD